MHFDTQRQDGGTGSETPEIVGFDDETGHTVLVEDNNPAAWIRSDTTVGLG